MDGDRSGLVDAVGADQERTLVSAAVAGRRPAGERVTGPDGVRLPGARSPY